MNYSEIDKFLFNAAKLNGKQQEELVNGLKDILTGKEVESLLIGIGFFRMQMYPELKSAMKESLSAMLYKEFNNEGSNLHGET